MFIHIHYGNEIDDYVIEFGEKCFITVSDVLRMVRYRYDKRSRLQLFNEHGILLKSNDIVEKARSYRIKRQSK